jgi:gamma-glutamyltranspeptidase/glutathione hydrolase
MVPKGLAETLRGVAEEGPDYMITGPWAGQFVAKANEMGWAIRLEHMTETPPRWVDPVRFRHHDAEIVGLGPPQTQGLFIGVALGVLKHLGVRDMEPGSAEHLWAMGHALRQATRHWEYAQDDTVYEVPRDGVLDDAYHAHLAGLIRGSRPKVDLTEHLRLAPDAGGEIFAAFLAGGSRPRSAKPDSDRPTGSCELAVVDEAGNWVQMMDTLQASGIPGMVIGGVPMVGSHASFGALATATDVTLVRGARPRGCVGSTFVCRNGRPVLSLGTPGNVHCTVPQVLSYVLDMGLDPVAAVDAPRMLPMTEGREVTVEDRLSAETVAGLLRLGVRVSVVHGYDHHMGSFAAIARDESDGAYTAVADPRRCAVAAGLP